jgi:hypothetical protein
MKSKRELSSKQKQKLVTALLTCQSVSDRNTRDAIVDDLRDEIKNRILRSPVDQVDVRNIVTRCSGYHNGIEELIETVRFFEGNSTAMKQVDQVWLSPIPRFAKVMRALGQHLSSVYSWLRRIPRLVWRIVVGIRVVPILAAILLALLIAMLSKGSAPRPAMTLNIYLNGESSQDERLLTRHEQSIRVEAEVLRNGTPVPPSMFQYAWSLNPSDNLNRAQDWSKAYAIHYYLPLRHQHQTLTVRVRGAGQQWSRSVRFDIQE